MSRHRHDAESRVGPHTPPETRLAVKRLRRRATRRELTLLECAIVRHAPFADCGRTLWELMAGQSWFEIALPPAEWLRPGRRASDWPESRHPVNGHEATAWLEDDADGTPNEDRRITLEWYFSHAEYCAEAGRFDPPPERRDQSEIDYGVAYWLHNVSRRGPEFWNVLDYYLASFPGEFYRWAGWRPLHRGHRAVALALIDDILGPSVELPQFDTAWRTADVVGLARAMANTRDYSAAPILADSLEEAGCDDDAILTHCRGGRLHVRGCWVVDGVLNSRGQRPAVTA